MSLTLRGLPLTALAIASACTTPLHRETPMNVQHLDPDGMHKSPAFSQAVAVDGPHRVVYVGGQNAVDAAGNIVGSGDIAAQSEQVARNLVTVLEAAGASPNDVVKWNVYLVQGQPPRAAFEAFQRVFGRLERPPAISVIQVAGLAHPEFLLELDAVAVVAVAEG